MSPEAQNRLAVNQERHLPGGEVKLNETPEVAIRHRLEDKLRLPINKVYQYSVTHREETMKDLNDLPTKGIRYVITYWYVIEPVGANAKFRLEDVAVQPGYDLLPGSELWVECHQLIDSDPEHRLGSTAAGRTPFVRLFQDWPYPHRVQKQEIDPALVPLQQAASR